MTVPAHPLQWPAGWKRTPGPQRATARFGKASRARPSGGWDVGRSLTIAEGVERVRGELAKMGVSDDDLVINSNLELRMDGFPKSSQREPTDPGVAVYWRDGKETRCMAVDRYARVADNLAAVAQPPAALRAIERHGGAEMLNRAFTGFSALPAPGGTSHWRDVLDPNDPEGSYRRLRGLHHPDRGGDANEFRAVQHAWDAFQQEQRT
jgi:hypothetical protein